MHPIIEKISQFGIVPVLKIEQLEDAVPLAQALCQGGLAVAEVTFRSDCAAKAIAAMKAACPDMLIGAGTVLTITQIEAAVQAGSQFIVSPGFNPKTVQYCLDHQIPIIPGTSTPSDMEKAIEMGLEVVKFFPAEASGGLKALKAMAAPYSQLKFMPTGGINPHNLNDYLSFDRIIACGGTWMVPDALLKQKDFAAITQLTSQAISNMLDIHLGHVGINADETWTKEALADTFSQLTAQPASIKPASIFVDRLECMPAGSPGSKAHLGFDTNDVPRAIFYLKQRGYQFDEATIRQDAKGRINFIYLKDEIAGMAIHLKDVHLQ